MNLIKNNWTKKDMIDFQKYLETFKNESKKEWATNLLKTNLPVLVIKTSEIKRIVNEIYKGNYLSFLDHMNSFYYENTAINGFLITKIKDFKTMKLYLDKYSFLCDNWASCDLLSFKLKDNEEQFFNLVLEYIKSDKPFVRRIGMSVLFNFIDNDEYINKIYELLDTFSKEENYYVNMMNSWLLCECFIKQRDKTLLYMKNNHLNKFTINKAIQKCRESYRVNVKDKEQLLKFKVK